MQFALALSSEKNQPGQLTNNPVAIYLASLSTGSRRTMAQSLNSIALLSTGGQCDALAFPWHSLTYQHTVAIRSALAERYAPATANKMLAAMKRVLEECKRLGTMSAQQYDSCTDIPQVKGDTQLKGRALSAEEISALIKVCSDDQSNSGARDAALVAIARCGLRRAEIVALDAGDIDLDSGAVTVQNGKGNKSRISYLPKAGIPYVAWWLELRTRARVETAALFLRLSKSDRILSDRLTDQAVQYILAERGKLAGLESFTPHDFRRTFVSDLLDAGNDIVTVQKLAGHSNPTTTAKYDRRGEKTKQEAAAKLSL